MAGAGKNMRSLGAVSLDLTQARTQQDQGGTLSGQSLRFLYAKSLEQTGTNFRMAGYRYSTSGYRTFSESVQMRYAQEYGLPFANRRNEIRLDVSQPLGNWGSVYVSARQQSYWNSSHTDKLIQLGYSGNYGRQLQPVLQPVFEPIWPIEPAGHADAVDPAGQDRRDGHVLGLARQQRPRGPAGQPVRQRDGRLPPDLRHHREPVEPG